MKKLSKRIISLVLALVMAMPIVVIALPETASAAMGDGNKILEWDFVGAKPAKSATVDLGNGSYDATVTTSYPSSGGPNITLHNYGSSNDQTWHYDGNNGMRTSDGIAYFGNLKNYLADGKDIDIKFTAAIHANESSSGKGIFAIGSQYVDSGDAANSANNLIYWRNDGEMQFKNSTDIRVGGSLSPAKDVFYEYRIHFDYLKKRINVYRDNILAGSVQNDSITKDDFGCLTIGTHVTNWFGSVTIKKVSISNYNSEELVNNDINNFDLSGLNTTGSIRFSGGGDAYSTNVIYSKNGDYDSNYFEESIDGNNKLGFNIYPASTRVIYAYEGSDSVIGFPLIDKVQRQNKSGCTHNFGVNYIAVSDATSGRWYLDADWKRTSGDRNFNDNYSGQSDKEYGINIISYQVGNYNSDGYSTWSGCNNSTETKHECHNTGDTITHRNIVKFKNSNISFSNGYYSITNSNMPTFKASTDSWITWLGGSGYWNEQAKWSAITINGKNSIELRVLDVRPFKNFIGDGSAFKSAVNDILGKKWMYTSASLATYYDAVANVMKFNINGFDYSDDTKLQAAIAEMNSVISNYDSAVSGLTLNEFTITYQRADGNVTEYVTAGNKLAGIPSNSVTAHDDSNANHHKIYGWTSASGTWDGATTPSNTHIPHTNETYYETVTSTSACTGGAGTPVAATSEHNGYTPYECSVCHHETSRTYNPLSWTAYNSALSDYNTKTTNGVYTTSTVATCVSDASAYIGYNNTSNTGANTPQSTINTATSAINTAVGKLKEKASFDALDTAYTTAQNSFAALNASDYTTSTYALVNTYLSTAGNFPYHSMDAATRANTAAETYQTAINSEKDALAAALTGLELRADFSALDTAKNDAIDELDSLASANTTSSVAAARTYLTDSAHFPYEYSADRANTGVSKNSDIATEAAKFGNWKTASPLEAKASFTALDTAKNDAIAELDGLASGYTTSSVATARTYLTSSAQFPYEYSADRADTGVSKNSEIATEATKFGSWKTAVTLDPLADLTEFDKAYAKADALLKDLAGKTAQYDEASVQALIDAVTTDKVSAGTNITAGTIAAATTARADYGKAVEDDAKELTENIYDAINGLTLAAIDEETSEPVDTSVYDSLVNTINNLDPDAYEENEGGSLASALRYVNENYGTETVSYAGETINVVSGTTTQEATDLAAERLQTALTVCTKKYTISRTGVTDFGVTNGKEEGGKVNYGATLTCKSSDNDTAWFLEVETGSMHKKLAFQSYGKTLKTKVLGATTVNAVKRDSTNNCKVIVYRNYGDERRPIQYATFLPSGTEFTLPASPAIAYTTFNGYSYKGGDAIAANGDGEYIITVTEDVEIVANYTEADADCAINATDINSVAHNSTVSYNEKVELDGGDGAYGWVEQVGTTYRPFYKGQKVSFLATESTTLVAVNEETFESYGTAPIINMRKGGVIVSESKYMFNAQIVPGDADIRECGILLAAPSSKNGATPITPADSQVIIENSGQQVGYAILRAKSTKLVGANQFTVAINNVPAGYKYRGYIIYHDGNSLQTVYSDVLTK